MPALKDPWQLRFQAGYEEVSLSHYHSQHRSLFVLNDYDYGDLTFYVDQFVAN